MMWVSAGALLVILLTSGSVFAEEAEDDGINRLVLLDVPGGGTSALVEKFKEIDPSVEVMSQKWFLKQVKARGVRAKKLLRRPKDLRWIISGGKIDHIIFLKSADDDKKYNVTVLGNEGTAVKEFQVDQSEDGLSETSARVIALEITDLLGFTGDTPESKAAAALAAKSAADLKAKNTDVTQLKDDAKAKEIEVAGRLESDWFYARLAGTLTKRDLQMAGDNGAVLSYSSQFYPGFKAEVEAYPLASSNPEAAGVGVFAEYTMGFGSVLAVGEDSSAEAQTISVTQLEIEAGTRYRLVSPLGQTGGIRMINANIKVSGRYSAFKVDPNRSLPQTSLISIIFGFGVSYPVADQFAVTGFFDVTPFGFWGDGAELFGESSLTYGFSSGIGGVYAVNEALGVTFGYEFRIDQTSFEGSGQLDFTGTEAFELVQGANLGILYQL